MISLERMLRAANSEQELGPQSCAMVLVAGLPPGSQVGAVYEFLMAVSPSVRRRCYTRPLVTSRFIARRAGCSKADDAEPFAWGVVTAGNEVGYSMAARINGTWWGRSGLGLGKVHPSRAVAAWTVK